MLGRVLTVATRRRGPFSQLPACIGSQGTATFPKHTWQTNEACAAMGGAARLAGDATWRQRMPMTSAASTANQARQEEAVGGKGGANLEAQYQASADFTLGDLWNRFERGLRSAEGEAFEFEVKPEHGGLTVRFPSSGCWVSISKEPGEHALRVRTTLFPAFENRSEAVFKLSPDASSWSWEEEEQDLYSFLEEGLARNLKVKVDLSGARQKEDGG